jgi:transposase
MVVGVDQYKRIRKMAAEDELSQREIARRLGISRNTVARYCKGEHMPWESAKRERKPGVVNQDIEQFIRSCLEHDKDPDVPKKQHHTARRIYERLVTEKGFTGGESTIRRWVNRIRDEAGEAYMPLHFALGEAAQADWGEATFYLGGERTTANLLCFRLCGSRYIDVRAYPRKDLESFLEGHIGFFERIGGVPRSIIYDNLRTAVRKDWGKRAVCQEEFERFSAHYAFTPLFCNIGKGNEKGLVEGLVGYARRNVFVPLPRVDRWAELNIPLAERCDRYKERYLRGMDLSVAELFEAERRQLLPLPAVPYEAALVKTLKVDHFSTIGIDGRFANAAPSFGRPGNRAWITKPSCFCSSSRRPGSGTRRHDRSGCVRRGFPWRKASTNSTCPGWRTFPKPYSGTWHPGTSWTAGRTSSSWGTPVPERHIWPLAWEGGSARRGIRSVSHRPRRWRRSFPKPQRTRCWDGFSRHSKRSTS